MERKFRIVGVQVSDQKVVVALQPLEAESKIRLDVIEELPSSETERIASRIAQAYLKQLKQIKLPGMPQPRGQGIPIITLELTEGEYRHIGSPTVYQTIILEFNIRVE